MDETLNLVLQLIAQYPLTTIVIDAMDECDPQKRHELLKALEKILQNSSSLVKIFVSSRNDQDIVLRLRNYPNLEIDSRRNCDDIARFVNEQVEELVQDGRLLSYSDSETEMKKLIVGKVIEGAAGMFRWASMQLQYLCSFELDDDIKSSLGRLPPDLNTLYDELYEMLSTKPGRVQVAVFKNTLCWLLCARKTLSTEELLCAVSIDSESGSSVKVPSKDLVLKICNNFIVFDPQLDTFRFAHLSVREYLEQRPEYGSTTTNALAAEMCLWIVLSASSNIATEKLLLQLGYSANALPKAFEQICTYADIYWPEHCFGGSGSIIALWNKRLRKHLAEYDYWDVKMPLEDTFPRVDSETCIGIFVSCAFDFEELIGAKVEDSAEAKDSLNRNNRSPLHIATTNGSCASVAKLLMMDQPRVETTQEVVVAAARSYRNGKEIMTLLLDKRSNEVQITQEVVVAAAGNEYNGKEIITLLLDKRGDEVQITQEVVVAAAGNYGNGKEVMTLLLNKRGDEVQITQEVVVAAVGNEYNSKEIITLLLNKRGDEVQITQEVVVAAAGNNRKEVMTLLLDKRGDEVQITQEVVVAAAGNNGKEIITLLLDKRGDKVQITQEIVVSIAQSFDAKVMTLLLKKRGDEVQITQEVVVAAAGNEDGLCAAAKKGDGEAVLKFTQQGVPPDERDTRRVTPLWHAAARGHTGTVRALLETNAVNVNAASVSKLTPLFWPAAHGYVEVVKLLLDYGAQQSYEDKDGRSPLTIARIYGQTKVVEILETKNVRNLSVGA
ncbi:Arp Ankyrin repeat protein [Pyrenophora tritici-repentis]|nr:Arp Ankyrin repeat protein [Pyrenophora tritici-repentis]